MTNQFPIAQSDLRCWNCAGQCIFVPTSGALTCQSCASEHEIIIDPNIDPTVEHHYDPDLPHTEQPQMSSDRPYGCETCGGEVIFHGHSISESCPYCMGALVERPFDESYPILGMIPFGVAATDAHISVKNWIKNRWAAPNNLSSIIIRATVSGMYVPFWTFDSKEAVDYWVSHRVKRGKSSTIAFYKGKMNITFDDLLVPASHHVTPLIRDGILHEFDPDNLRQFDPAYLAGFAAERHHHTVREGLQKNRKDKDLLLRNRIKKHSQKKSITNVSYKTDTTGIKYRRILLPVWIMHYEYNGKPMKVVTCGLHGRTYGERPFSTLKLLAYATALATGVAMFGFAWGAGNLY